MNVTNLPYNDLLSCPMKLVVDDTGIGSGYKTLMGVLSLTYNLLVRGFFSPLILSLKVADMLKLGFSLFRFILFGRYNAVRVSPALSPYKIYRYHFGKLSPETHFRMK